MNDRRFLRRFRLTALLVVLNVAILVGVDYLMVKLDIFRPPFEYGDSDVGFGHRGKFCTSKDLGVETSFPDSLGIVIAMVGDSHSMLGPLNKALNRHQFVFEAALREKGVPAIAIAAGRGRYSPLQEYLLFTTKLRPTYSPRVVVMNFYTGNDFHDMFRPDDRPHFVRDEDGSIQLEGPVWLTCVNPDGKTWPDQSRLLWIFNRLTEEMGYPRITMRLKMLNATVRQTGGGFGDVVRYVRDVKRSIEPRLGYTAAFSAQILNQAIFFDYFPDAKRKSLEFVRHLLTIATEENPDVLFVMSPIPSAALVDAIPPDISAYWQETLERVGLTEDAVRTLESELYEELRCIALDTGWLFVDLRGILQENPHDDALYNSNDLHVTEGACQLIGRKQAQVLWDVEAIKTKAREESGPLLH